MSEVVQLFKRLAEIDSVSGEEIRLSEYICRYLEKQGIEARKDEHGMVYARTNGGANDPLLFCAHMDTVEPGRGVRVRESEGYLVSGGNTILGGDNKASLAAMLMAVSSLKKRGVRRNIELLFTVREETDSGVKEIKRHWIKSKKGFIFDGGNGSMSWLVEKAPNITDFKINFKGKTAHASRPEEGVDALRMFSSSNIFKYLGRWGERSTFNCGKILGGVATNSVMPQLVIEGDLRSSDEEEYEKLRQLIEAELARTGSLFRSEASVEWKEYAKGYHLKTKGEGVTQLKRIYKSMGIEIDEGETVSASDAGFLNSIGIETYCLGDGVEKAHTKKERIEVKKLLLLEKIVEELMMYY